jgi:hypothetical protein
MSPAEPDQHASSANRVYTVCFFDREWLVPQVNFLDACNDEEAVILASSMQPWMQREVWDRHRLIKVIPRCGAPLRLSPAG